ncbi:MAG: hypothetical protein AUH86_03175 [Acidobacteria bacterium 13_1_40CM_4_58_4]|nr:MAG: hypothetical protein AUH86_03175 [Acidobacteria bacterium 13_1_40CM_4_58_4]
MSVQFARRQAEHLIERWSRLNPPVNVERIARSLGLPVIYGELGDDISGLLVSNAEQSCDVVNEDDPPNRQRFTIAHEIGHFWLKHQFEPGEHFLTASESKSRFAVAHASSPAISPS